MTAPLPFTGERFTPEITGAIGYEHWHRYGLALPGASSKSVLDAACGEGYGSMLLARVARDVTGIDVDAAAIAHARARYGNAANVRYIQGSCAALPLADEVVDLIVSFETIEHLAEQQGMLAEFRRVLRPDGALMLSSPNKPVYAASDGSSNHFHVRELTEDELRAMLESIFPQQHWYGQRVMAHSLVWSRDEGDMADRTRTQETEETRGGRETCDTRGEPVAVMAGEGMESRAEPAPPMYFVVVCGSAGATLPLLPAFSLFDDGEQSLYRDYGRALDALTVVRWEEADARKIADERLQQAIGAVNAAASARERAEVLSGRVIELESELASTRRAYEAACTLESNARTLAEADRDAQLARAVRLAGDLDHASRQLAYRDSLRGWAQWPLSRLKRALASE